MTQAPEDKAVEAARYRKQRVHGLPDEEFWAIMRGDAEIAIVPIGLEKEADEIVAALTRSLSLSGRREEIARLVDPGAWSQRPVATHEFDHIGQRREKARGIADAIIALPAPECRAGDAVPESFIREFMANRHFWAAKDLDIIARKDGEEYRLEADWLKPFIRALSASPPRSAEGWQPMGAKADEWNVFLSEHDRPFAAVQIAEAIGARDKAIAAILADPHGCVFCDSGKLRNPKKDHEPCCGFALARALTTGKQTNG